MKDVFNIIKIKNTLTTSGVLTLTVIYCKGIIAEIRLRLGKRPVIQYANQFLSELAKAETVAKFKLEILAEVERLAMNK